MDLLAAHTTSQGLRLHFLIEFFLFSFILFYFVLFFGAQNSFLSCFFPAVFYFLDKFSVFWSSLFI